MFSGKLATTCPIGSLLELYPYPKSGTVLVLDWYLVPAEEQGDAFDLYYAAHQRLDEKKKQVVVLVERQRENSSVFMKVLHPEHGVLVTRIPQHWDEILTTFIRVVLNDE